MFDRQIPDWNTGFDFPTCLSDPIPGPMTPIQDTDSDDLDTGRVQAIQTAHAVKDIGPNTSGH